MKGFDYMKKTITVHYGVYKKQYCNFETVKGSYNPSTKTIDVIVPANEKECKIQQLGGGHNASLWLWKAEQAMKKADGDVKQALIFFRLDMPGGSTDFCESIFEKLGYIK